MARRSRGARFVRPAPRTKIWIGLGVGQTSIAGNTKALIGVLSAGALALRPFTILRSHLSIHVRSDQITAIETPFGAYGQMVVTDTAAALGVTAIPDPSAIDGDADADWYLWSAFVTSFFIDINGTDGIGVMNNGVEYIIDSKAMRKVGPDDDDVMMIKNNASVGFNIITHGRQLIQLH